MRVEIRKPTRQRPGPRPLRRRREEDAGQAHDRQSPTEEFSAPEDRRRRPNGPEERERRTGGPQDRALYSCRCGATFQALVSASVSCPHCGEPQAW